MTCGIIDIGSNSIRLSVYQTDGDGFIRLFSKKSMAGLAGYVDEDGALEPRGIQRACETLDNFRDMLRKFSVESTYVFATASLRNVANSAEALTQIEEHTGYDVEIVSGHDEALFGFYGCGCDFSMDHGKVIDIGGGSVEVTCFTEDGPRDARSAPVGSLKLYRQVAGILPTPDEVISMRRVIDEAFGSADFASFGPSDELYGVGGTARAALKLTNRQLDLEPWNRTITIAQLEEMTDNLLSESQAAAKFILTTVPERIHTIIPGLLILTKACDLFEGKTLSVSRYGAREGYLCRRVLQKN